MIGLVLVRRATEADAEAVRAVHAAAFAGGGTDRLPEEVTILDALVAAGDLVPALSLVAVRNGEIVGHVACSEAAVDECPVVALGPIGVLPPRSWKISVAEVMVRGAVAGWLMIFEPCTVPTRLGGKAPVSSNRCTA